MSAVRHRFTVEEYRKMGEAGIPEAWLMDLNADTIEVYSGPGSAGYGRVARCGREERVVSVTLPNLAFDVSEALPPER